ncbi:hypothetical protein ACR0S4_28260 [Priestia megaterium]|uniref:hypothetical protein n=1 Tax=Priestia megaterium TaxID=1404 RepID=UPI003D96D5BA
MQKLQSLKLGYVQEPIEKAAFVHLFEVETKTIVEWFADCWNKADGKSITSPANFSFHDYDPCYDLHKDKWISDGDKWNDLIMFLSFFKIKNTYQCSI